MWPRLLVSNSSVVGLVIIPCRNGGDCSTQVKMLVILIQVSFGISVSQSLIPQQLYVLGMNFHLFSHLPKWSNGACLLGALSQSCRLRA